MSEKEIVGFVEALVQDSVRWTNTQLAVDREDAMTSYLGEGYPDDDKLPPGHSRVVTQDVLETVEWLMPSLMRIFAGGKNIVNFSAVGAEDEALAKQETEAVHHTFWQSNCGFMVLHNAVKDALLQKTGIFLAEWREATPKLLERYTGLDEVAAQKLLVDDTVNIESITPNADDPARFDFEVRRKGKGRTAVDCIPPDEFIISRNARDVASAPMAGWRREVTISEARNMGYDVPDDIGRMSVESTYDVERQRRFKDQGGIDTETAELKGPLRMIWLTVAYVFLDYDDDGIAERRRIVLAEDRLLLNEEVDDHPFALLCPVILPHRAIGLSIADLVMDLQLIRTTLFRQMLNNIYHTNQPRMAVQADALVDIDEALTYRIGGLIRTHTPPAQALMPIAVPFVAGDVLAVMNSLEEMKASRTGVTKYNQGLDQDALNPTATGVEKIMNAANVRIEMIARIFAETGLRELFIKIHKLLRTHYAEGQRLSYKIADNWISVEPRAWAERTDVTAGVGLGTGDDDQQLQKLGMVAGIQEKIIAMQGGANGPLVTLPNIYATASQIVLNAGLKTPERYFTDPIDPQTGKPRPQPPAPPDPTAQAAQAALQIEQQKAATAHQKMLADVELARWKAQQEVALARWKVRNEQELALARWKARNEQELALRADKQQAAQPRMEHPQ